MATSSQTVTTSAEIPKVLEPFYTRPDTGLIDRATAAIYPSGLSGIQAYQEMMSPLEKAGLAGSGRIAGLSEAQQATGEMIGQLGMPSAFGQAYGAGAGAQQALQGLTEQQAQAVAAPELTQFQLGAPQQFGMEQAQQYMSPYMQAVIDAQQRNAIQAAQQAQLGQNLAASRQGTYGGARQALMQGQREAGLRQQLGDIQAQGLQSAYASAQAQFERDRAAQMGAERANLEAALGVQQLGAGQSLEAQRANQAAALQAAQQRQAAAQGLTGLAQTLGGLGTQQLAGEMDIIKTTGAYGDLQRSIEQAQRDAQAQYLQEGAQYGLTQVGNLSNILRGVPIQGGTQSTVTQTPPPSFASQLTGLGLTGLGVYNMLQGG